MNEAAKKLLKNGLSPFGLALDDHALECLFLFSDELKKWGKKINLTAIVSDTDIAVKHLIDSLSLAPLISGKGTLLDMGSGAGFPAIPLKVAFPELEVVSVDAVEKKIFFQRHAARLLQLDRFEAVHCRGEELAARYGSHFDWAVSRAFSDIPTFVQMVLPLLKPGGTILAMKGKGGKEEAAAAEGVLAAMGAEVKTIVEFRLPHLGDDRAIVIIGGKRADEGHLN